jgi:dihydrofolate synthase/folylpolyglutamate synthase
MGFLYFARHACDLVVLEVGIGGLYDPTNVVTPLLSLIMRVDYDHTELLGSTLTEIARQKAGIGPAEKVSLQRFEVVRHR